MRGSHGLLDRESDFLPKGRGFESQVQQRLSVGGVNVQCSPLSIPWRGALEQGTEPPTAPKVLQHWLPSALCSLLCVCALGWVKCRAHIPICPQNMVTVSRYTHAHTGFLSLWWHSIGVMGFILSPPTLTLLLNLPLRIYLFFLIGPQQGYYFRYCHLCGDILSPWNRVYLNHTHLR